MKHDMALKLAASTLVLGLTMVGCKPAATRPATASAATPKAEEGASKAYAKAQEALGKSDFAAALGFAERAVELSPRDSGYRMLLADLYLKNGRFVSAETAFSDVLTLDPNNSRAGLSRALALIGVGKTGEAVIALDGLASTASPVDVGLAFALAGQPQRAIEMLEPAARAPGANGRVRQNLALAYAIAGDWQKARIVAAQDLSPNEVAQRLEHWASLSRPTEPHHQVASLLGVSPAADSGQPVRLALAAPVSENRAFAEAQLPAAEPAVEAPVQVAAVAAPVPEPVVAEAPAAVTVPTSGYATAFSAPAATVDADVAVPSANGKKTEAVAEIRLAAAVQSLVETPAPVAPAAARVAPAPIRAFQPQKLARKANAKGGRFVVQIGAFKSAAQVEKAWAQAQRRYRLAGGEPLSTTVTIPGKGTFHRLAVSGFETPLDASRLCQSVRAKGGACFVRPNAGDAPVRWASRYASRRA